LVTRAVGFQQPSGFYHSPIIQSIGINQFYRCIISE